MRITWLVALAGCAAATTPAPKAVPTATPAAAPARHVPTRTEMLAALPADTSFLIVVDIQKLRRSPIAARGWEMYRATDKFGELFGDMCGYESNVTYALVGYNMDKEIGWAWIDGLPRDAKLDCPKAVEHQKAHPSKTEKHGDYWIEAGEKNLTETYWLTSTTGLYVVQNKGATPVGADKIRHAAVDGGGFASASRMQTLLDHVDFASGLAVVLDGVVLKQPGLEGMALSVEADDGIRAQGYIQFDNEDRASELRASYRTLLDRAVQGHMIDSGEARVSGTGMAVSLALTRAQVDWWIDTVRAKMKDGNAATPPPPSGTTN